MSLPVLSLPPGMALPRYGADASAALEGQVEPSPYPLPPGFPGAAPGLSQAPRRSVLLGDYAECALNGSVCVFLFQWSVNMKTRFVETTGFGDRYATWTPLDVEWTAAAKGYVDVTGLGTYINQYYGSGGPLLLTFTGFKGAKAGGNPIFQGQVYVEEGEISVPMSLAEQMIKLRGTGPPSVGIAGSAGMPLHGGAPQAAISAGSAQGNVAQPPAPTGADSSVNNLLNGIAGGAGGFQH